MQCEICGGCCACHISPPCSFCTSHSECEICGKQICNPTEDNVLKNSSDGSELTACYTCIEEGAKYDG